MLVNIDAFIQTCMTSLENCEGHSERSFPYNGFFKVQHDKKGGSNDFWIHTTQNHYSLIIFPSVKALNWNAKALTTKVTFESCSVFDCSLHKPIVWLGITVVVLFVLLKLKSSLLLLFIWKTVARILFKEFLKRKSYRFGMAWWWVNGDTNEIFE